MISKFFLFHIKHYKTIVYICYTLNAQTVWHEVGPKCLGCVRLAVRAHLSPPLFDGVTLPTIQLQDADLAIRINNWITRRMLQQADRHVAKTPFGQQVNEMRTLLRTENRAWTLTEITRKTRGLKPKERSDILQTLILDGTILEGEKVTGGRSAMTFLVIE